VTHVFGVIGTAMLEVFDALYDCPDITYVGVRHEQNAVHMADAFGRVSGRAGVVLAGQPGPGATNLVTGIAEARLAFSPVVLLVGATASNQVDRDTFQEVDQQALFTAVSKRTTTAETATRFVEYVQDAFRVSESGRRGPVVVNLPGDLLADEVELSLTSRTAQSPPAPGAAALEHAASLLNAAERPLIIAGAGVKWARASDHLVALAERLNAPVVASAGHGDVIPNDHPLSFGQVGPRGNEAATELARSADVILALGTRLGYNTTLFKHDNLSASASIIHVDVDPLAIGRHFAAEVGIVADAGETAAALRPLVAARAANGSWLEHAGAARADVLSHRAELARSTPSAPFNPVAVYDAIQGVLPRNAIVTVDTGTISLHATDTIRTFQPPALLTPLDFGLVAFSHAAGLGAKAAAPDRPVVSLIGDGGFGMAMVELGTAIAAGLNTVTVVLNNGCWGAEKAYQRDFFGGRYLGADIVNPAFDEVARAFGATGIRAATVGEIAAAVEAGLTSDRPTVVEVEVDPATITSFRRDSFPHRAVARAG